MMDVFSLTELLLLCFLSFCSNFGMGEDCPSSYPHWASGGCYVTSPGATANNTKDAEQMCQTDSEDNTTGLAKIHDISANSVESFSQMVTTALGGEADVLIGLINNGLSYQNPKFVWSLDGEEVPVDQLEPFLDGSISKQPPGCHTYFSTVEHKIYCTSYLEPKSWNFVCEILLPPSTETLPPSTETLQTSTDALQMIEESMQKDRLIQTTTESVLKSNNMNMDSKVESSVQASTSELPFTNVSSETTDSSPSQTTEPAPQTTTSLQQTTTSLQQTTTSLSTTTELEPRISPCTQYQTLTATFDKDKMQSQPNIHENKVAQVYYGACLRSCSDNVDCNYLVVVEETYCWTFSELSLDNVTHADGETGVLYKKKKTCSKCGK